MYLGRSIGSARLTSGASRYGSLLRPRFKVNFTFDRSIIRTNWPRFNRDPLMHAGNLVMKIARGSIKRRSRRMTAPVGKPPYSHADTPNTRYGKAEFRRKRGKIRKVSRTPPFKQIFSVPYVRGQSVIVGMVGYTRTSTAVPGLHEHSGFARRKVFTNLGQRRRKSGQWGRNIITYRPKMVKYPQRPFMVPALMRARTRLPRMWYNSLTSTSRM